MARDVARQTACVVIGPERLEAKRQERGPRLRVLRRSWRSVIPYRIVDEVRRARAAEKRWKQAMKGSVLEGDDEPVDVYAALRIGETRGN